MLRFSSVVACARSHRRYVGPVGCGGCWHVTENLAIQLVVREPCRNGRSIVIVVKARQLTVFAPVWVELKELLAEFLQRRLTGKNAAPGSQCQARKWSLFLVSSRDVPWFAAHKFTRLSAIYFACSPGPAQCGARRSAFP